MTEFFIWVILAIITAPFWMPVLIAAFGVGMAIVVLATAPFVGLFTSHKD